MSDSSRCLPENCEYSRLLARIGDLIDEAIAGSTSWPEDLVSHEREDDHEAAGRREVDVVDGCLGNVGHPHSYVVPLAAQRRWTC